MIGMTSLGSSCLSYMKRLKPAAGSSAVSRWPCSTPPAWAGWPSKSLARQGYFAAVLDLALPELGNLMVGSAVNAGEDRLTNAGAQGIPQIVSPGCADLIDFPGWQEIPAAYAGPSVPRP